MLSLMNGVGRGGKTAGPISSAAPQTFYISTTNLLSACGVVRLVEGYNGPAIRVIRDSDSAESDIGFATGSDLLDTDALNTFRSGSVLRVMTVYDQSGNGLDKTQTNSADRPAIYAENIDADGIQPIILSSDFFNEPAGFTANRNSVSDYQVMHLQTYVHDSNSQATFCSMGDPWNGSGAMTLMGNRPARILTSSTFIHTDDIVPRSQKQVMALISGTSELKLHVDNDIETEAAAGAGVFTGGFIGRIGGVNWRGFSYFFGRATYTVTHSDTQAQDIKNTLYGAYKINTTATTRLIVSGNSIAQGSNDTLLRGYMKRMEPLLNEDIHIANNSIFGRTLALEYADRAIFENYYDASFTNIVQICEPSNDIFGGALANDLWSNYALPFIQAMKTAGYEEILVPTTIPRAAFNTAQETERLAYNTLVRNNAASEGYIVADYDSLSITYADDTHPNEAGHQTMAVYLAGILNGIL